MRSTISSQVNADLRPWPYDSTTAQLVLLDLTAQPTRSDIERWIERARQSGAQRVRTSALFPGVAQHFTAAGFVEIDRLALLEIDLRAFEPARVMERQPKVITTYPLRRRAHDDAAQIDRRAFTEPWGLDATAIGDVLDATPESRARCVRSADDRTIVGFAISGRSDTTGYLQRLAVDPQVQRGGLATALVHDSLLWMRRRVGHALVNTGVDNGAALELYRRFGFTRRPDDLVITEYTLR